MDSSSSASLSSSQPYRYLFLTILRLYLLLICPPAHRAVFSFVPFLPSIYFSRFPCASLPLPLFLTGKSSDALQCGALRPRYRGHSAGCELEIHRLDKECCTAFTYCEYLCIIDPSFPSVVFLATLPLKCGCYTRLNAIICMLTCF
jgi:hypothetical protein